MIWYAGAAPLETLDKADPATDFQTVPESRDFGVFTNEFQTSIGRRCVEYEQKIALFVLHLFARFRMQGWFDFLHAAPM